MTKFLDILREYVSPVSVVLLVLTLLLGAVISALLELASAGVGVRFTIGAAGWFGAVPPEFYALTGGLAGAYTVRRGYEKVERNKYAGRIEPTDPTARVTPDNPEDQ